MKKMETSLTQLSSTLQTTVSDKKDAYVAKQCHKLCIAYNHEFSDMLGEIWIEELRELPDKFLFAALGRAVSGFKFMPKVSEIKGLVLTEMHPVSKGKFRLKQMIKKKKAENATPHNPKTKALQKAIDEARAKEMPK